MLAFTLINAAGILIAIGYNKDISLSWYNYASRAVDDYHLTISVLYILASLVITSLNLVYTCTSYHHAYSSMILYIVACNPLIVSYLMMLIIYYIFRFDIIAAQSSLITKLRKSNNNSMLQYDINHLVNIASIYNGFICIYTNGVPVIRAEVSHSAHKIKVCINDNNRSQFSDEINKTLPELIRLMKLYTITPDLYKRDVIDLCKLIDKSTKKINRHTASVVNRESKFSKQLDSVKKQIN